MVLADTGPLYALRDPDDASHGRAREDLENLGGRLGVPVWTYDHHFDVMGARVWRP